MREPDALSTSRLARRLAALGGVYAAAGVALAAYASHAAGAGQGRLLIAAAFAFGHGVAMATLAPLAPGRTARVAVALMAAGTLLFCGSLVGRALWDAPATLAPFGGSLLIAAWLAHAVASLRR